MDKREKIRKALLNAWGNVTVDSLVDTIMRIDEPAEPKRDWLRVDTDTPKGTLAVNMDNDNPLAIDTIETVYQDCSIKFDNLGPSDKAERFIGIHLLDNPGLDAQPCEGLVLMAFTSLEVEMGNAQDYDWDFRCAPPHILQWAPVKWVEGRLVVDLDRLRGES